MPAIQRDPATQVVDAPPPRFPVTALDVTELVEEAFDQLGTEFAS
jgi:hypothetical protein